MQIRSFSVIPKKNKHLFCFDNILHIMNNPGKQQGRFAAIEFSRSFKIDLWNGHVDQHFGQLIST